MVYNVANKSYSVNQEKIISKTKNFIFKMRDLESKLESIENALAENNTQQSRKAIKIIKEYLKILSDKYNNFLTTAGLRANNQIVDFYHKNEIQHLKKYLRSRKWIYQSLYNQTDILNTYWYAKAEAEIIEELNVCLDSFKKDLQKLKKVPEYP